MFKLLIVEDEKWEREGLLDFLDWESLGIGRIETACDGIEGMEKSMALQPDIIISDIKMPGMDGISMSKKVREFLPDVKIIILTGYDDFRYAKEAISFKANAYILKPLEEEEMIPVIQKVVAECNNEREKNEMESIIMEQLNESLNYARAKFLDDLIAGSAETQSIGSRLVQFGVHVPENSKFTAVVVKIPVEPGNACNDVSHIEAILESMLKDELLFSLPSTVEGQVCLCLCSGTNYGPIMHSRVSEAYNALRTENGYPVIAGIGKSVDDPGNISHSFSSAFRAVEFGTFWSSHEILHFNEIIDLQDSFAALSGEFLIRGSFFSKQLIHAVRASDEERVSELLDGMFGYIRENRGAGRDFIINYLQSIVNEVSIFLYTLDRNNQDGTGSYAGQEVTLSGLSTLQSLEGGIREFFRSTLEVIGDRKGNKDEQVIKKVIRLIEERYMSDISLKIISGEVFLSPNYLGNIFKKCTGRTFNDYLCEYRMEKAKELLRSPKNKVSWVASKVGIPNTSYFCTIFRNTYGIAPGEYQEMLFRN